MYAVVSSGYHFKFCNDGTALLPAKLGKATGGKRMTLKRESIIKKTNSSLNTNDTPERAGSSPSCVVQCKTFCFLHTSSPGPDPQQV